MNIIGPLFFSFVVCCCKSHNSRCWSDGHTRLSGFFHVSQIIQKVDLIGNHFNQVSLPEGCENYFASCFRNPINLKMCKEKLL